MEVIVKHSRTRMSTRLGLSMKMMRKGATPLVMLQIWWKRKKVS